VAKLEHQTPDAEQRSQTRYSSQPTLEAIVDKLAEALNKGLSEETVQKRLADFGAEIAEPECRGPKALADLQRSEVNRLGPILKAAAAK
jgi:putative tricarboxylic transport membrane protein